MPDIVIQASFNSGEWSPQLFARVDIQKYRSGAALLENFYIDYRGGASTRPGTKYILQAYKSATPVRLITFQASFLIGYALEFGDKYIRFYYQGAPVLEPGYSITNITKANPAVVTFGAYTLQSVVVITSSISASYAPGEVVTLAGGTNTIPATVTIGQTQLQSIAVNSSGDTTKNGHYYGYAAGDTIVLTCTGSFSPPVTLQVVTSKVNSAIVNIGGSGGTPGTATVTGTTGVGTKFQANVTIGAGGNITAVNSITSGGAYTTNPNWVNTGGGYYYYIETVTGAGLVGAELLISMGVGTVSIQNPGAFSQNPSGGNFTQSSTSGSGTNATFNSAVMVPISVSTNSVGAYSVTPSNPVSQASTTGSGVGITFTATWNSGVNLNLGDWVYISGAGGMTQINTQYFSVLNVSGSQITLGDLNGNNLDTTAFSAYTSGGQAQRIYTLATPYAATDLALLKFAQSTNEMVLCHPNYAPQLLTLVTATNWTLAPVVFGATVSPPTGLAIATTLSSGSVNYSYTVTAIDFNGQESSAATPASLASKQDIRSVAGSNSISWTPNPLAQAYNVYESEVDYYGVVPNGINYGFIGTCRGSSFVDSNIGPDFSQAPPIAQNPFYGNPLASVTVTIPSTYTTVPTATTSGGGPGIAATLQVSLGAASTPTITGSGSTFAVGDTVSFGNGLVLVVNTVSSGHITSWSISSVGSITTGSTPSNPVSQTTTSGSGTGATATVTWGVEAVTVLTSGMGYTSTPVIVFSAGSAAASAVLATTSAGNPGVPSFFQQRLVLAASISQPQTFWMSQPGLYFNFNINSPIIATDAITETLVSGELCTIKSIVSTWSGMLLLTDYGPWLVTGGSAGSAVSPETIVANPQAYVGASDVPPIRANYDVLYVQAKGSAVRDLSYNIYFGVFTGTDISVTASHLFYGYNITQWAWAEQPFYVAWAVRNDGTMLTLTFLKEQEFVGWTHQTTQGLFRSVCAVTESTTYAGNVDAVYTVVQRTVNGSVVQYIERIADRVFPNGLSSAWCVDAGIQYQGLATLSFQGAQHLAALTVTGLATDNLGNVTIITPFTMPVNGEFTLPAPTPAGATGYTTVTLGLAFTCKLQTLAIDTGQVPIQGKLKKIPEVNVRVNQTLGLTIGSDFNHQTPMKDLVLGNVSSQLTGQASQIVTGLVAGDARTILDNTYTVPGQYCIEQSNPYPASILGVFPTIIMGDVD